jgi:Bleomycin resistance protein-like N-terminal
MGNPFVHVELDTADVARAKSFYGQLFHWKLEEMPSETAPTADWLEETSAPACVRLVSSDCTMSAWLELMTRVSVKPLTPRPAGAALRSSAECRRTGSEEWPPPPSERRHSGCG